MIWDELDSRLADLRTQGLQRRRQTVNAPCSPRVEVAGCPLLSFCSNDYLGLAAEPELIEVAREMASRWGVGSGSSHLLGGHLVPHEDLEQRLAEFVGSERALYFSTGYMANLGVVPALVGRGDAVFADRMNHASLIDSVQLSRAEHRRYAHNDMAALEGQLAASTARRKLILTDAVFSMDGDLAPVAQLLELAERYDAWLVCDDAHGFGVLGPQGRGSLAHAGIHLGMHPRLLYIGTLGKAAGVSGAFVAGAANVIEWLMQRARSYIFTTAASPIVAGTLIKSIDLIELADARRTHLFALIARLRSALEDSRWQLMPSRTPIQPIIVGDNTAALHCAAALADRGILVPPIRPPTVPKGTARLRISLSAAHSEAELEQLLTALGELQSRGGVQARGLQ